jgi:hypothetical protein
MKKWPFIALLLVGATLLGATVLREPIANAAQSISAHITGPLDAQRPSKSMSRERRTSTLRTRPFRSTSKVRRTLQSQTVPPRSRSRLRTASS